MILYCYRKDNTPGCTRQACAFAGSYEAFKTLNAAVTGISKNSAGQDMEGYDGRKQGIDFKHL